MQANETTRRERKQTADIIRLRRERGDIVDRASEDTADMDLAEIHARIAELQTAVELYRIVGAKTHNAHVWAQVDLHGAWERLGKRRRRQYKFD